MAEPNPALRQVARSAALACGAMAVIAWAAARGEMAAPIGVVAGGALVAISYGGIRAGIDAVAGAISGEKRGRLRVAIGLVKFFTRYAILAVAAYAIMARFRLPPVAVFAGASSLVVAVTFEALRGAISRQR